jgi:tetratricopeptide (TPR) repeat protein
VGRARQYEERSQFNDAAGQWDILRSIYPLYPGLDFEIERLGRRREEQVKNERKARWVEQVDRHFEAGRYAKAREVCEEALQQFPDDPELNGLHRLAEQGIRRNAEANVLLRQGQELCAEQQYEEGLDALRKAERLDPPNTAIHAVLLSALTQRARELMGRDWHLSEPLVKEASEIDSGDPVVRALASLIDDHKRQDAITGILLDARNLQAGGELQSALRKVEAGLELYPNEIRLSQLHNTLSAAATGESRRTDPTFALTQAETAAATASSPEPTTAAPEAESSSERFAPVPASARSKNRESLLWLAIAAGIIVIAAALLFSRLRNRTNPPPPAVAVAKPSVTPTASEWLALPLDLPIDTDLLNPMPERVRLTLQSNAAEGVVFVNGKPLAKPMTNGSRVVSFLPGTYKIKIAQEGYEDSPEQTVQIKPGDTNLKPLIFTLAAIPRPATLVVQTAPAGADVILDGQPSGVVDASGTFSKEVGPGAHSIALRKEGFEDLNISLEFKAGEKSTVDGQSMRPYGTVAFRTSPAGARILYRRDGDTNASSAQGNETVSLKSGSYFISAEADNFKPRSETIQVSPGKAVTVDWTLQPASVPVDRKITLSKIFENAGAWTTDKSGWWSHGVKGYSFLRANQGRFVFDILKETQRSFFKSRTKKVIFVADYRGEDNRIVYTLDGRGITRRLYSGGRGEADAKAPLGMDSSAACRIEVDIAPSGIVIRDRNGKVLDSIKRQGPPGKFGFQDEVTLSVASAP